MTRKDTFPKWVNDRTGIKQVLEPGFKGFFWMKAMENKVEGS
jgi:hypothetical protein